MKAVLQGEFHISSTDRESLGSHINTDVDALFVERREDRVSPKNGVRSSVEVSTQDFLQPVVGVESQAEEVQITL